MESFKIEIDPTMVHVPFPFDFYHSKKDVLGIIVELVDDFDHRFSMGLKFGGRSVVMWEGVEHLKRFYRLDKKLSMFLKYEGGIRFKIEMKDEEINKIVTPVTPPLRHVNQMLGANTHGVVIVSVPHNPNHVRVSVVNHSGRVTAVVPRQVMTFEKVITKSQSRGGQTLLILEVEGGRYYSCTLLWRPGSEKDCHLGKPWYKLVSDMKLKRGYKLVFRTIIKGLNRVKVDIVRKGG
ncbi:DNA-binding barrel domain superfamily [Sesbania bispinosa]|nr:DNA-binding barrel domain superfamily [Sesbania bispinosa]